MQEWRKKYRSKIELMKSHAHFHVPHLRHIHRYDNHIFYKKKKTKKTELIFTSHIYVMKFRFAKYEDPIQLNLGQLGPFLVLYKYILEV